MNPLAAVIIAFGLCPLGVVGLLVWECRRERRDAEHLLSPNVVRLGDLAWVEPAERRERAASN